MAWTSPTNPVAGTVITVAYAIANYVNNLIWLRGLTGNADPPGSNFTIRSTSTSASDWSQVTTDMLANLAVTNGKMADNALDASTKLAAGSVTVAKMAAASVGTSQLVDLNVTNAKVALDSIDASTRLAAGSVTLAKMAAVSVDSPQIVNGSIDPGHFAAQAVQAAAIANGNVQLVHMSTGSVGNGQLVAGAVTYDKTTPLAALNVTQAAPLAFTTSNQDLAVITAAVAGTYRVHATVVLYTTNTTGDQSQPLIAELNGPAGLFGAQFKWTVPAGTAADQTNMQHQTQLIALTAAQTVTLRGRKGGGTGSSGAASGCLVAERIAA